MEEKIKELIDINIIKRNTIDDLLKLESNTEEDKNKYLACRRFVSAFILELRNLKDFYENGK